MAEEEVPEVEAEVDMEDPPAEGEEGVEKSPSKKEEGDGDGGAAFSPIAILLRLLQLTLAVITFAVMASVDGFNDFSGAASFNLIVAIGVIITAWTLVMLGCEFGRSSALAKGEAFVDHILALLAFGSFCAAGAIQSKIVDTPQMVDSPKVRAPVPGRRRVVSRPRRPPHPGRRGPLPRARSARMRGGLTRHRPHTTTTRPRRRRAAPRPR